MPALPFSVQLIFSENLLLSREIGLPGGMVKNPPATQMWRCRLNPWVGKIPCRRKWQPVLVSLPGEFLGLRSLVGYNPWGCKQDLSTRHKKIREGSGSSLLLNKTSWFRVKQLNRKKQWQ